MLFGRSSPGENEMFIATSVWPVIRPLPLPECGVRRWRRGFSEGLPFFETRHLAGHTVRILEVDA